MRICKRQSTFHLLLTLPALLGLAFIMSGCVIATYDDGTITAELIGADGFNGYDFYFDVFPQGVDAFTGTPVGESVAGGLLISGGVAIGTAVDYPTGLSIVIFQGGENYYIFGFVDYNNDGLLSNTFPPDQWGESALFTVNGDMLVILDEAGFTPFTP